MGVCLTFKNILDSFPKWLCHLSCQYRMESPVPACSHPQQVGSGFATHTTRSVKNWDSQFSCLRFLSVLAQRTNWAKKRKERIWFLPQKCNNLNNKTRQRAKRKTIKIWGCQSDQLLYSLLLPSTLQGKVEKWGKAPVISVGPIPPLGLSWLLFSLFIYLCC